jgi:SAM-dependent methyltransferase
MSQLYDAIGVGYQERRRPDPRLTAAIVRALGDAATVVNVGAGAGSYEPSDRSVVAVEPAMTMIRQRRGGSARVVRAFANDLPFRDDAFAASLAILTVHHWPDWERGLAELARVARQRVVVVTWDPVSTGFWLVDDYFPEIVELDRRIFPTMEDLRRAFGRIEVRSFPVPHDCIDGFMGAYWRRPHAYLDPSVRAAISAFAKAEPSWIEPGLERLQRDLADGTWERRHANLFEQTELELGYRIVIAEQN